MKRILPIIVCSCLLMIPQINAQDVPSIRKKYASVRENIARQKEIAEMRNNAVLTFNHNVPGIGPQTFKYEIFFTPYGRTNEGDLVAHKLTFIQCSFNIAAHDFYEEYLYDESGNPIFIFNRQADESEKNDFIEKRMYYHDKSLIKMTVSTVSDGNREVIMEGKVLGNQYNYLHETYNRAVSAKKMLQSINENINPNASN